MAQRHLWAAACTAASAIVMASPATAFSQTRQFSLPAMPAATSIAHLARQANVQVLVSSSIVRGKRTNAVRATVTIDEAFRLLLAGTGLHAVSRDGRTFMILTGEAPAPATMRPAKATVPEAAAMEQPVASAPATQPPPQSVGLADIVVTAQKRAQNIQDVGLAVTAVGSADLAMIGRQDIRTITAKVPSLQVQQYAPTITVFNIRGVSQNDVADSQEAPIAFYNDEVYVGALGAISGQNFDLERLEVLRGPQGTLFGRNATGGLVQVVTAKPTDRLEGFLTVTGGSFDQIATEGAISGPISETVRGRFSFTTDHHDGYLNNLIGEDPGNARFYGARAQIEADLSDRGTLKLKAELLRNDHEIAGAYTMIATGIDPVTGGGVPLAANENFWGNSPIYGFLFPSCEGCNAFGYRPPSDPLVSNLNHQGLFDRTYWNLMLRYDHTLDFGTFTWITSYQNLRKRYSEDSDGSPNDLVISASQQNLYQLSQEVRLAGSSDRINWVAGAYGLHIDTDNAYSVGGDELGGFVLFGGPPPNAFPFFATYGGNQRTDSIALFGQVEYKIDDVFSLTAGGRYSWDWKRYDFHIDGVPGVLPGLVFNPSTNAAAEQFYGDYSGKLQLDVRPNRDTLLYISVNRGTKSGGFGVPAFGAIDQETFAFLPVDPATIPFRKEVLTSYEAGFKLTLLDRRMTFNASAFHYDYKDYQLFSTVGFSQFINNRPAKIDGIEAEVSARPIDGLTLSAFATYLIRAKVRGVGLPSGLVADRRMPQTPEWSVGWSGSYELPVGDLGALRLSTDWKYDSAQYFTAFNAPIDYERARIVGNARLSFSPRDRRWEAAFFVNNLTDRRYRVFSFDNTQTAGGVGSSVYSPPRWFGGSLTYRFGDTD